MSAPTNIQIINDPDGRPAFVVISYDEYIEPQAAKQTSVPHEAVSLMVDHEGGIVRAWYQSR